MHGNTSKLTSGQKGEQGSMTKPATDANGNWQE
jgi:hypothetical protein